jgi:hypothetical protein
MKEFLDFWDVKEIGTYGKGLKPFFFRPDGGEILSELLLVEMMMWLGVEKK